MAINTDLLVAAPMLQDVLIDNVTALPMSNGVITCYKDNSRTTLKNWYYQSGSPGAYTYIRLPNPMVLSGIGTIVDVNGVDTIPFFYPFSEDNNQTPEPYYITVVDSNGQQQFTRQNFPFLPPQGTEITNATLRNYLINNVFWRNAGTVNTGTLTNQVFINNSLSYLYATLAPSQHDGFSMPDIIYLKNKNGATEAVTFVQFTPGDAPNQTLDNDITPEYYLNFDCSGATTGETIKCVQIPISLHIKTLESVEATIVIHAQTVGGGVNNQITVSINQFLGTGQTLNPPIVLETINLTNNWTKYTISFVFPSALGLVTDTGGDDAFYLQIGFPLNATCNINIAKPQIYLSNEVPTNDFDTYDEVDTVINSPRTGDVRTSVNSFSPFGWVPMNNGTIGNSSSNATARANQDTWPLFNLLWSLAKPYDSGSNFNPICQMVTSAGSNTNFGSNAIADFNANNAITLTKMFGEVVAGTVPISSLLATYTQSVAGSDSGGNLLLTVANGAVFFNGQSVTFKTTGAFPGNIVANAVYYIANLSGNTFNVATTYANAIAGTPVVVYASPGSSTNIIAQTPGSNIGEYAHTLSIAEMPNHDHPGSFVGGGTAAGAITRAFGQNTLTTNIPVTVASQGDGVAHNNVQPLTFYNVFMKL